MTSKLTYQITNIEDYKALVSKAQNLSKQLDNTLNQINNFKFETKLK